jgi:hypothetical protein
MSSLRKRTEPYTARGIRRLKCSKCGRPAFSQWYICALGSYKPICVTCDLDLNLSALIWTGYPSNEVLELMEKYRESIVNG